MSEKEGQFVMVPFYLAENPKISFSAKAVYMALKSRYPKSKRLAIRCSIDRLMALTGASRPVVIKALNELEQWRLIKSKKEHRTITQYSISLKAKDIKTVDYIKQIEDSWVKKMNSTSKENELKEAF